MSGSSSSSSLYLEQFLSSLESLPKELDRNFTLMRDLDEKNKQLLGDVDSASVEYLRQVRELSPPIRKGEMEKIQKMFKKAKAHGDDKVQIAIQTYELVDKHIRRLDADLAKFEAEMKEKGRLSQTESEEEDEEEEEVLDKKKGRKKNNKDRTKSKKSLKEEEKKKTGKKKQKGSAVVPAVEISNPTYAAAAASGVALEVLDMVVDPNEPTYCICNQVSYGEMIGCDNPDCPIEWFHFGCMELSNKPKGKWYCPNCLPLFKKKK